MNFRINSNTGCLPLILIGIVFTYILILFGKFLFTTPIGLVLVLYMTYIWYKKKKKIVVENTEDIHTNFSEEEEIVIDVDYEEFE